MTAHLTHHVHNPNRPGQVPQANRSGYQIAQTDPYCAHKVESCLPGVVQLSQEVRSFSDGVQGHPTQTGKIPVFVGTFLIGQMNILQFHHLTIPSYHKVQRFTCPVEKETGVAIDQYLVAVYRQELVAGQESAVFGAVALNGSAIELRPESGGGGKEDHQD